MENVCNCSTSIWQGQAKHTFPMARDSLREDLTVDVCIVGGGIAGLTSAYCLLEQGYSVALLDESTLCRGQSARTTAHLSNALDDHYYELEEMFGEEGTRLAAESHAAAIDFIETLIKKHQIECQFERVNAYLFCAPGDSQNKLDKELKATHRAGLTDVHLIDKAPFASFDTGRCVVFPKQAQFSPIPYFHALSDLIVEKGGKLFLGTHVEEVKDGEPCEVTTRGNHKVTCKSVIVATNTPFNSRVIMQIKQAAYRSYVIAGLIDPNEVPPGLYYDTLDPYHYVRVSKELEGTYLIVGGEDHKTGQDEHPTESYYASLEKWTREHFASFRDVTYKWSGQIIEPIDGLAYIGRCPLDKNIYIATGDSGNGLTHGTIAGLLLTDLIMKKENRWEQLYDPSRVSLKAFPEFAKENCNTAAQYLDWIGSGDVKGVEDIAPGSGAILSNGLKKVAVYKDEEGNLHSFSAVCPHLKAIVQWNSEEKSWDCPAHGSRFTCHGEVIDGPANDSLCTHEAK
ncbi:MAG: FAD-dependent oxidoreductase [Parachlamydiaceae bacterium]|nr:FAD-dependent oxidoreductase [Parachlamydiaceae bacterium]